MRRITLSPDCWKKFAADNLETTQQSFAIVLAASGTRRHARFGHALRQLKQRVALRVTGVSHRRRRRIYPDRCACRSDAGVSIFSGACDAFIFRHSKGFPRSSTDWENALLSGYGRRAEVILRDCRRGSLRSAVRSGLRGREGPMTGASAKEQDKENCCRVKTLLEWHDYLQE